ncbi:short-chain dehydrogenase/reductase [Streptomyces tendae]|uniref:SDR family NAD(P)-dependent oxidoreductase n=1 Tax=Streptomyces tendae TaxID=1932 RepID=UPI0016797862|nr:SDR family NAD(P)-dependent oxidoreductase [Streptomyces tendae]GHB11539.1 short-chain dehydrogenase/reductase [Streptomyces tendae]
MSEQVWFITGSSRGLGRSVAEEALAAGHRVVATARRTKSLDDLAARYGDRVLAVELDVTDPAQAQAAVDTAVRTFGRIDVVVNNAGYADIAPIEEVTLDAFRAQVDACFYGTVYVTKAVLPLFRKQNSGYFIQVTSVGGRLTAAGLGAYQAAKYAVEGFSGVLHKEVAPLGIRVTLAEPGGMRTDWAGSSMEIPSFDAAYEPTVGAQAKHLRGWTGTEPIDPAKVARVFLDLADHPEPPLHLVLGGHTVDYMAKVMEEQVAEDAKWAEVGRSVDFDD